MPSALVHVQTGLAVAWTRRTAAILIFEARQTHTAVVEQLSAARKESCGQSSCHNDRKLKDKRLMTLPARSNFPRLQLTDF